MTATVPTTFGATVKRFVLTVEYPRLATICGRKLLTLASGTPNDRLMSAHILRFTQYLFSTLMKKQGGPICGILERTEGIANVEVFVDSDRGICKYASLGNSLFTIAK
jgi:hypothetical protein